MAERERKEERTKNTENRRFNDSNAGFMSAKWGLENQFEILSEPRDNLYRGHNVLFRVLQQNLA